MMARNRKVFRRTDGYDPVDLLQYAVDHRDAAVSLFSSRPEFYDSAGYLAHASVELLLKAVCLHVAGEFEEGHALLDQLSTIEQNGLVLEISDEHSNLLKRIDHLWDLRYPNPSEPKPVGHSDRDALVEIWSYLLSRLPRDLLDSYNTRPTNLKGGRTFMVRPAVTSVTERQGSSPPSVAVDVQIP